MWDISRCQLSRAEVYVHVRCLWVFNSTKGPKWHWEERKKSSRNYLPHQLQQNLDKDFHAHFAKQGKTPELLMWPKRFHETHFDEKICWCEGQHFPVLLCHLIPISLRFVFDTVDTPHPPPLFMLQGMEIWINGTREIYCKWVRPSQQKNRERERACKNMLAGHRWYKQNISPKFRHIVLCCVLYHLCWGRQLDRQSWVHRKGRPPYLHTFAYTGVTHEVFFKMTKIYWHVLLIVVCCQCCQSFLHGGWPVPSFHQRWFPTIERLVGASPILKLCHLNS